MAISFKDILDGVVTLDRPVVPINYQLAEVILDALRAAGYSCGIVGGYARDKFFGLTPKDMDICVAVGKQDDEEDIASINSHIENILFRACYEHKLFVERMCFGMYNDHASDRACGVIKYPEDGIDVILYRDCGTVQDIINSFDFNLNQFSVYEEAGADEYIPIYSGSTDLRRLETVRGDHCYERGMYVLNKHRALRPQIDRAYSEGRL